MQKFPFINTMSFATQRFSVGGIALLGKTLVNYAFPHMYTTKMWHYVSTGLA